MENWTSNTDQFVQDENEESYSYSVRISGQELIEVGYLEVFFFSIQVNRLFSISKSIASDFAKETVNSLWKTIGRVMENAQKLREANNENWWKLHEACLLILADIKPVLQELIDSNSIEFDLNSFFNQFVVASLHESS